MSIKRIIFGTVLFLLLLFFTFFLLELTCLIYDRIHPSFLFSRSFYNKYKPEPYSILYSNDIPINSSGFHDMEHKKNPREGIFRIVGIGDSFVFGEVPYKYNFLTVLEEKLNKIYQDVEVINLGVPFVGPKEYNLNLNECGLVYKPDLIICCLFVGNDFIDCFPEEKEKYSLSSPYLFRLIKLSYLLLYQYASSLRIHNYVDTLPTFNKFAFLDIEIERTKECFMEKNKENLIINIQESLKHIKKMKDKCDDNNISFLLVIAPDNIQVDSNLQSEIIKKMNRPEKDFNFYLPNNILKTELEKRDIQYIDLLPEMLNSKEILYIPFDTHWNIAGNSTVSQIIYEYLKK